MKFVLQLVAAAVAVTALGLLLVGFAFPATWRVERSLLVNAEPTTIHELVSDLHSWPDWADAPLVAEAEITIEGTGRGAGAVRRWRDARGVQGRTEITRAEPGKGIWFSTEMGPDASTRTRGSLSYTETATGTEVVWRDEGPLPRPFGAYFKDGVERDVRLRFERGLQALKALAEARQRGQRSQADRQPSRR